MTRGDTSYLREMREYSQTIERTNVTGLGSRADYEVAFGAVAGEQRCRLLAWIPFLSVLRDAGVEIGGLGSVGVFKPDEPLPDEIRTLLERMSEIVDATPTQVHHMRELGGVGADDFSVKARMEWAIVMVTLGDVEASLVRNAAWERNAGDGWVLTRRTRSAARRFGLAKRQYVSMASNETVGLLPPIDSLALRDVRARDKARGRLVRGAWVSFESLAVLASQA